MSEVLNRAAALRDDFDRGFAQAPPPPRQAQALYLAIAVGDDGYAVALEEVTGLTADCRIAPLPSRVASCLGLAALKGGIVAVHGLRPLLGYPAGDAMPRWLLLAGGAALAFDRLDGCLQLDGGARTAGLAEKSHIAGTVAGRPLLRLKALMDKIAAQTGSED